MRSSSPRTATKPKKAPPSTGKAAAPLAATRGTARGKPRVIQGKKAAPVKTAAGERRQRPFAQLVDITDSQVMAHDAVMKGVTGRALTSFLESSRGALPPEAFLKAVGLSARTVHRIKAEPDKLLGVQTSDGFHRLRTVYALAEKVLGSIEAANEWLNTEAMGLEFRKPIDLISTSPGFEAVKTLLQRMQYGVYA